MITDLKLRLYPDPILKRTASAIPSERAGEFKEISEVMFAILKETGTGVGLAANQVGLEESIVITNYGDDRTFLNPIVLSKSDDILTDYEGCLSFPGVGGYIVRSASITLQYMSLNGETKTEDFSGTMARIVQHEVDHVNGINHIDAMSKNELRKNKAALKALVKASKGK